MAFGPLELSAYLRRKSEASCGPAALHPAHEATAPALSGENILTVISGPPAPAPAPVRDFDVPPD